MSTTRDLPRGPAKTVAVREMFDAIAARYDRVNRVLTLGMDLRWRRKALEPTAIAPGDVVVDVAAGSGDFCAMAVERGASAFGVDPSSGMLAVASARLGAGARLVAGTAEALPIGDATADVVTCGFALRNFTDLPAALAEMARVLRPGGRLVLLDVATPEGRARRAVHHVWFHLAVPVLGGLLSDRDAYRYLPQSAEYLPSPPELVAMVAAAGFADVERATLGFGAVAAITATRARR